MNILKSVLKFWVSYYVLPSNSQDALFISLNLE